MTVRNIDDNGTLIQYVCMPAGNWVYKAMVAGYETIGHFDTEQEAEDEIKKHLTNTKA